MASLRVGARSSFSLYPSGLADNGQSSIYWPNNWKTWKGFRTYWETHIGVKIKILAWLQLKLDQQKWSWFGPEAEMCFIVCSFCQLLPTPMLRLELLTPSQMVSRGLRVSHAKGELALWLYIFERTYIPGECNEVERTPNEVPENADVSPTRLTY